MKYRICFVQLLILLCASGIAQTKPKIKFTSVNELGILTGESTAEFQMQSINGFSYKTFITGIGIGVDDYYERTFPLFVDIRKSFSKKESAPFVYADAGYSFISKSSMTEWEMDRKGGAYYAVGIGYEISTKGKVKAVFDVGYSYKRFSRIIDNEPWRSSLHYFDTYDYSLSRISMRAGLRF
jgi:hypothetical protein